MRLRLPTALWALVFGVAALASAPLGAQALPAGADQAPEVSAAEPTAEPPLVSMVTVAPGTVYWQRFGHIALLLRDPRTGMGVAYNYGIFDFGEANFMVNFARGIMRYRMSADRWGDIVAFSREEGRWVLEQPLNLSRAQRAQLAEFLNWNMRPENIRYPYDYFKSNCSTRVRDALDRVLDGALKKQLEAMPGGSSYRQQVVHLMAPEWLLAVGMDVGLGPLADRPISLWDESFIPMVLRDAVRKVTVTNPDGTTQPLVAGERQWVPATGDDSATAPATPVRPPDWRLPFALAGFCFAALLALLSLARAKRASRIVFGILAVLFWLMCSLAGLTLVAMWAATEHWGAWRNENLLLLNPLCLLLIPAAFDVAWSRKLVAPIALAAAGTLLFKLVEPLFATGDFALHQDNAAWILLLLPVHAVLAWDARRRA